MLAVWMKLATVWKRSWWLMLIQILTPIILLNAALGLLEYILSLVPTIKKRMLSIKVGFEHTETLLGLDGNSPEAVLAAESYQQIFEKSNDPHMTLTTIGDAPIQEYYLSRTHNPIDMGTLRHQILIGSTFTDNSVTAWFSNFGYHDLPMSLAAVHSALLKTYEPNSELTVYNHPLKATYEDQTDLQTMIILISMQLSTSIGSSVAITIAIYIMFYIKERVSGAKLLQRSAGLPPIVMWGCAGIYDYIWLLIFCIPIPITCAIFKVPGISTAPELARLWICIMIYGAAMIPLTYLLSLLFGGPALGFVCYFFLNVALGMLGAQLVESLLQTKTDTDEAKNMADNIDSVLQFHPHYCLVTTVRYLNQIGLREQRCFQMCDINQVIFEDFVCNLKNLCEVDEYCCLPSEPHRTWETPGVLRYMVVMFITGVLFWILLMMIEYGLLKQMFIRKKKPPPVDKRTIDEDVAAEETRTQKLYKSSLAEQALLAIGLSKYYGKYLAVNQVTFCVNDGECFGLLGVNGAGKTTTFKMIMGDESISSGEAFVSGHSVEKSLTKANQNIGYCPQFDALFMELTGRETLRIYSLMRGLRTEYLDSTAETFSKVLGFRKHLDKKVYQYSGGTRRKLNTAVAFLGNTRLIFVDEPTTGVDPAAKRHMWNAVRGLQHAGRGIVLTSHSMEECEALCSRLTIMVNGRFQCLGTPQHLKIKYSQGFTLIIKLKLDEHNKSTVTRVKEYVNLNFKDPRIMEEYQGLLTYYLPDRTIAWSRMFAIMERAKRELDIEDYTIAQTTLEQIFLQFTKYQGREPTKKIKEA